MSPSDPDPTTEPDPRRACRRRWAATATLLAAGLLSGGCRREMYDQARIEPFEGNSMYADGRGDRPPVPGTVARGELERDELLYRGTEGGQPAERFPFPVTAAVLDRGRERYDIYCTPCHDRTGSGGGMVVQRGLRQPPSFHDDRLRQAPPGHFFDVITNGFGAMTDYADRIDARDRWSIVAYVRALQASHDVPFDELPEAVRSRLSEEQ